MGTEGVNGGIPPIHSHEAYSASETPVTKAAAVNIVPSRIAMAARKEAMNKAIQNLDVAQMEGITKALAALDKKDIENLQRFTQALATQKAWSSKYLFSSIISSISAIATGSVVYSSYAVQGITMGVGGSLQLFNTFMDYRNGWQSTAYYLSGGNKEREETIRAALPFATNLLILACTTYTFLTIPTDQQSLMATINQFMGYVNMALGAVEIVTIYKKNEAEQKLIEGQNQRFELTQENELVGQDFEFHVDQARINSQADKKATEQYIQATSRLAAKTA
ncbi:MAG TPA: hypothetical protein VMR37_01420 [Rhabdochlamydiaceae bacterium]|nr:hypothetical protein [Rhabdochlamydiaceae bacterium]